MTKHLTLEKRVLIQTLIGERYSLSQIAARIGYSRATLTQELQRSVPDNLPTRLLKYRYDAYSAQFQADKRAAASGRVSKLTKRRQKIIVEKIKGEQWSPEQLVNSTRGLDVSASTIYNWINNNRIDGLNNQCLRRKGKLYRTALARKGRKRKPKITVDRSWIVNHNIEDRPDIIDSRNQFGHWEIDGVESGKSLALLLTFTERKTRFIVAIKIPNKQITGIKMGIDTFLASYSEQLISFTSDRGSEFISSSIRMQFTDAQIDYYYAHPRAPFERGSNENCNGLIREYLPKGTDFSKVSQSVVTDYVTKINSRPCKTNSWHSRQAAFNRELGYQRRSKNKTRKSELNSHVQTDC